VRGVSPRVAVLLVTALLALGLGACTDVRDRVDAVAGDAAELTERARFCLNVTRALTAIDADDPATAAAAAEELLAQAPDEVRGDARTVVEALRAARHGDRDRLDDPEVQAAAERLRGTARDLCDPTG
jgi:hypothetical protein